MSSAVILIADGTEEMEFTIAFDTLTRAGLKVYSMFVPAPELSATGSSVTSGAVATCSRGVRIISDGTLEEMGFSAVNADLLVIPGGAKGAETISQNRTVQQLISKMYESKKLIGMICAGSLAVKTSALPRQPITSHPSVKAELDSDYDYREDPVVVSGNLVTSRGPGTAFPFALKLVELLLGSEKRCEVQGPMVFPPGMI